MRSSLTKQSKFLSLVLRHRPADFGIAIHPGGWARLDDILARAPLSPNRETVETIMRESGKARPAFSRSKLGRCTKRVTSSTPRPATSG